VAAEVDGGFLSRSVLPPATAADGFLYTAQLADSGVGWMVADLRWSAAAGSGAGNGSASSADGNGSASSADGSADGSSGASSANGSSASSVDGSLARLQALLEAVNGQERMW
jgi:hypothetical protein